MTITVDAKVLLGAIKKVEEVTSAKNLNFHFSENNLKITAMVNQYRMELNLPIECQEECKFCIFTDSIMPILENKELITFELSGNNLKFKAGRSHGNLITIAYEEIPFADNKGEALDDAIKNFIFQNLYRVSYSGKNVSENIPLKVQIKDNKIKMLGMEMNYSGLIIEPMDGTDDAEFSILLKYATLITKIFPIDEELKIVSTDSSVEIYSKSCKVVLPKIADGESITIEGMEQVIAENVTNVEPLGKIQFQNPKEFLDDLSELQKFITGDNVVRIKIYRKDEKSPVEMEASTKNGKLKKKIDAENKVKGVFDTQLNLENLKAIVEKNLDDKLVLSIYPTFCTIRSAKSKYSIYMLIVMR